MKKILGRKPVLEALNSGIKLDQVIMGYGLHGNIINKIRIAAKKRGVKLSQISTSKFKELEQGKTSQGVIAFVNDYRFYSLKEIIDISKKSLFSLILILDSIQDPHNLGAILRTAESAGVDGVVITTRNSASINETVEKTSAGAVSHLKICKVNNLNNSLKELKNNGFWIAGSYLKDAVPYTDVDYKIPLVLVVGNEEKGIRRLISENCDYLIKIPMKGKIQSLNVSVAAGILLYEVLRQRKTYST